MEKTTRIILGAAVCVAVLIATTQPALSCITNGNFAQDPPGTGWSYGNNNVSVDSDSTAGDGNGKAILRPDNEDVQSLSWLSQGIGLEGNYILSFDMVMEKSIIGGETDTFTATFADKSYTKESSELDEFDTQYAETVTFVLYGLEQANYTLLFKLDNQPDGIFTRVILDNVILSQGPPMVPVPGALLLGGLGSALVVLMKKTRMLGIVS